VAPAKYPTFTVADLQPGDIVISEFTPDAYSGYGKWIERYNQGWRSLRRCMHT